MTRLNDAQEIVGLASDLGLDGDSPVNQILDYCRRRIDGWVADAGGIVDIDALETLVCQRLKMVFEEIRSDDDFDRLKDVYAKGKKEFVFAAIRTKFDDAHNLTYGALIQRRHAGQSDPDRFVAIIDCRGTKLPRRFFTRWHEIAHRLTTHTDMPEPVFRSEDDPIERMMDEIAGHIGFYQPIFEPAYLQASEGNSLLTFGAIEAIICRAFPSASFQATMFACARRLPTPMLYLEAALDHKKEVKRLLATKSLFDEDPPPGELRAVKVIPNQAAQRERFTIPKNMRVPLDSVIHRLFDSEPQTNACGIEDLSQWESGGRSLDSQPIVVEARKVPDRVIAIVQPQAVTSSGGGVKSGH